MIAASMIIASVMGFFGVMFAATCGLKPRTGVVGDALLSIAALALSSLWVMTAFQLAARLP